MRAHLFIIVLNALGLATALPTIPRNEKTPSCLELTPKRLNQINEIAQKIGEFIENLTNQYEDIDISSVGLTFEKHLEDGKQRETVISVDINECSDKDTTEAKDDSVTISKVIKDFEKGNLDKGEIVAMGGIYGEVAIEVVVPSKTADEDYVYVPSCSCAQNKPVVAEVMTLEVSEEQEKLLQAVEASRPGPLVLLQRNAPDGEEIFFL